MPVPKCFVCNRKFKKNDDIMVTDGKTNEAIHDECHYEYLSNMHKSHIYTLEELKEEIKESEL